VFTLPIIPWKNNKCYIFRECVCSLCCSIARLHNLINGKIFWKKLFKIKCVFRFCLKFLSETFLILNIQRDIVIKCTNVFKFLSDSNRTWNFLEKFSGNTKYHFSFKSVQWGPSSSMRTDRYDETKSLFAIWHYLDVDVVFNIVPQTRSTSSVLHTHTHSDDVTVAHLGP
jgi:hypothetical protein